MVSKDMTIEQLLQLHDRLVRIAYNASGRSDEVLKELESVAVVKQRVLSEYEASK